MVGPRSRRTELDRDVMTELELFIDNDGELYRQQTTSIEKNLYLKMVKGAYSAAMAPKLWGYLIEAGAKKYAREFASAPEWSRLFPKAERDALAIEFARRFERQVDTGEMVHLHRGLPKKYQRTEFPRFGRLRPRAARLRGHSSRRSR